jgi:hypothetical protein
VAGNGGGAWSTRKKAPCFRGLFFYDIPMTGEIRHISKTDFNFGLIGLVKFVNELKVSL